MKSFLSAATVAFSALGFFGLSPAQSETLRVGMECTYMPFNYRTPQGELAGYDVDVAQGIAEIIDADLEYVCQQFDGLVPALLANKFDIIVASMSITEERLQKMDFSIPYRVSIGRFVGPTNRELNLFDEAGQPIAANFDGLTVGVERSTTYHKWIEATLPNANVQFYDGAQTMLLDLRSGRVDVAISNPMKVYLEFLSKEEGKQFSFVSPPIDEPKYFGIGVGVGVRKGQEELVERINGALKTLFENGSLEAYSHKYFPFAIQPGTWQGVSMN